MIARVSRACSARAAEASKEPATSPCCAPLVWLVRPAVPCVTCESCECFQSVSGAIVGWSCVIASSMLMCSSCPKQFFLVHLYDCDGACELVGAPEVFYEKVCDGDGFGSSGDANAPLPGL